MPHWKGERRKRRSEDLFATQTLKPKEMNLLIRCIKDEFKELIESGGQVEEMLEGLNWIEIKHKEEITFTTEFTFPLSTIRCIIRGMRTRMKKER